MIRSLDMFRHNRNRNHQGIRTKLPPTINIRFTFPLLRLEATSEAAGCFSWWYLLVFSWKVRHVEGGGSRRWRLCVLVLHHVWVLSDWIIFYFQARPRRPAGMEIQPLPTAGRLITAAGWTTRQVRISLSVCWRIIQVLTGVLTVPPPSRCPPGNMAAVLQWGWVDSELGVLQRPVRAAGERALPGEGDLHRGVSQLHIHHHKERHLGRWKLLYLLLQCVPWRFPEEADVPHRAR